MPFPLPIQSDSHMDRHTPQLSAEGYGEPQTRPANQAGQNEDLQEFSIGRKPAEPAGCAVRRTKDGSGEDSVQRTGSCSVRIVVGACPSRALLQSLFRPNSTASNRYTSPNERFRQSEAFFRPGDRRMTERSEGKLRLLAIATHPVQYMAPIFRRMAKHPRVELRVAYCSMRGAEAGHDPEFDREVKWDVPLLDGYEWIHIPNKGSGDETFWGFNNPGLKEIIHDGKFDAVICLTGYVRASFWIARRAAKKARAAFLFGADATTLDARDGKTWKKWFKRITWPYIFGLADQVVVPSTGTHDLMRSLGIPEERITLTPYSVDNDWWMEQAERVDRNLERGKLGFKENESAILFCAKLQPWKKPLDLLQAYAKTRVPGSKLIFAGDGPQR